MSFKASVAPYGESKLITIASPVLKVTVSTLGATVHSVKVYHTLQKRWIEVNMQYGSCEEALKDTTTYTGTTVGRFAGRISHGQFTLDEKTYNTPKNAGENTIHGGGNSFDKKEWAFKPSCNPEQGASVAMTYLSPHMENGFPGELECTVTYTIPAKAPASLRTDFDAKITDASPADATPVNMFNHCYWNLNGFPERNPAKTWEQAAPVYNHWLRMPHSHEVVVTDANAVPNGKLAPVAGTPLDFCVGAQIGQWIDDKAALNREPCGYDHPFFISHWKGDGKMHMNAEVYSPSSGLGMQIYSTFPCFWVYTANMLKMTPGGTPGERFGRHRAVALEPQHLPDNVNVKAFPQSVARRGKPYRETMLNEFHVYSSTSKM